MARVSAMCEREYERTYYHYHYTPKWRLIARFFRGLEWKMWLHALAEEVEREYKSG